MLEARVLITDLNGSPREWRNLQDSCCYYARDKVKFSYGESIFTFRGGRNEKGEQSLISIAPVVGVTGPMVGTKWLQTISRSVDRDIMYHRDLNICAYCGDQFPAHKLTIDHILPVSKGGKTTWMNCITACKPCNHRKADRTPEQAHKAGEDGMVLLYVPYVPNRNEKFILENRNILSDQMEFLVGRLDPKSRIVQNIDKYIRKAA